MAIDVYILTSPFDANVIDIYRSLTSLSKKKNTKGMLNIKKIMVNSELGLDIIERYNIEETPAVIIGDLVISEGNVSIKYLHNTLKDIIEEEIKRTNYIY